MNNGNSHKLFLGNTRYSVTEAEIRTFVGDGDRCHVTRVEIVTDRETGKAKGFAFVEVENVTEVAAVIAACHEMPLGGRSIIVEAAKEKSRGAGGRQDRQDNRREDNRRGKDGKRNRRENRTAYDI